MNDYDAIRNHIKEELEYNSRIIASLERINPQHTYRRKRDPKMKLLALIGIILISWAILGGILALLWNWIVVDIFRMPPIDFWQGFGLAILLSVVGSFFRSGK